MAKRGFTNFRQWQNKIRKNHKDLQKKILPLTVREIAEHVKRSIQDFVPPGGRSSSIWPGYAATGTLKRAITIMPASGSTNLRHAAAFRIFVAGTPSVQAYAGIHEHGGIIRGNPYLTFKIKGQWVRVKMVRIRAKHWWQRGFEEGSKDAQRIANDRMRKSW